MLLKLDGLDSDEIDLNLKGGEIVISDDEKKVQPQVFEVLQEYVSEEDDGENHL